MFDFILLDFHWSQLLQPQWYIENGGIWFILFAVFAETGLFAGFFFPGDSLLFVAGIWSNDLVKEGLGLNINSFLGLVILGLMISIAGIIGNYVGYWFGKKSGPFLYERKDSLLFKKKYLIQAHDFYEEHGGAAIIFARFLPIVRTFAPIVAGVVGMDKKKFTFYNVIGCFLWVYAMLLGGHYLQRLVLHWFHFDLKKHLEVIVIGIVLITTAPVLIKLFFGKKKQPTPNQNS
ncbi:DedA family protein [Ferruginibacter albus]|uniref:DedA family protein n=1 Tax=Ferruginibacter albus TaxID=2875540 RepID=UPI001CC7C906|nr:VTT domain-containing protein [Ferruginibacter albus]UAY51459.1 VTT domain-containing protein [Ferruginibacter albus]